MICITETWLTHFIYDKEILPKGYTLYRKDRESRGGGVLIAVNDHLPSILFPSPPDLEVVTVRLCPRRNTISICAVYIPPNPDVLYIERLIAFLNFLSTNETSLIIIGDFNLPDICWASLSGTSLVSNLFCDFVFEKNLSQLITCPTHIKGNTLDIVLTNDEQLVDNLSVSKCSSSLPSDHYLISFNIPLTCSSIKNHEALVVYDADYEGLCDSLLETDFSSCFLSNCVELVWCFIKHTILHAMDLFIPKVRVKSSPNPKWFNPAIRHTIKCLRTHRRKCHLRPTPHNLSELQSLLSQLKDQTSSAKLHYEQDIAMDHPNKIFKYIKSLTSALPVPPIVSFNSSTASTDSEKILLFNKFFHSVFAYQLPPLLESASPTSTLSDIGISESDVFEALCSLDTSKAIGIDGIGPNVLHHCALALYKPLHHLFLLSLSHSNIPAEWRTHMIIPVFKSGDKSSVCNYCPISLLCSVSKLLEKLIYDKIIHFVSASISSSQFGFRPNHSTTQQLLIFLNSIQDSLNSNCQADVIYLDFKKAFDSVSHNELLTKFWSFGITGNLWRWFKAYLSQHVKLNHCISDPLPVISGVPQGSILGPLLFLIFVNDLPSSAKSSNVLLFADDTKCLKKISSQTDCHLLQEDLLSLIGATSGTSSSTK